MTTSTAISRDERCALLAEADAHELVEIADRALDLRQVAADLTVLHPPETGTVVLRVHEPVALEHFHLGEVVVTRAEVALDGHRGRAMRLGTDRRATLAAALCDALAGTGTTYDAAEGGSLVEAVQELCGRTRMRRTRRLADEWSEFLPPP